MIFGGVEPWRRPPFMAIGGDLVDGGPMDDVTWQTEAEQQADQGPPRWRRPLGIALGIVVALVLIGARLPGGCMHGISKAPTMHSLTAT